MKSIEELLEIIKGVDMDLWDNVEQEAYDEILSRFAEQNGVVKTKTEAELIIANNRIVELEGQIEKQQTALNYALERISNLQKDIKIHKIKN